MTARAFGGRMVSFRKPGEEDVRLKTPAGGRSEMHMTGGEKEVSGPLAFSYLSDRHRAPGVVIPACTSVLTFSSLLQIHRCMHRCTNAQSAGMHTVNTH